MKLKEDFELQTVCTEKVLIGTGAKNVDFSKIVSLNDTAAFLWETAKEQGDFTADSLTKTLCENYEVTEEKAMADVENVIAEWTKIGLIAE